VELWVLRHDRDTHERGVTVRLRTVADLDLRLAELCAKVARKHDLGKRTTHWRRRRPGRKAARAVEEILKTPAKGSMGGLLRPSDDAGMFLQWVFEVPIEKEDPREPLARSDRDRIGDDKVCAATRLRSLVSKICFDRGEPRAGKLTSTAT
jgi:hypothetical protein